MGVKTSNEIKKGDKLLTDCYQEIQKMATGTILQDASQMKSGSYDIVVSGGGPGTRVYTLRSKKAGRHLF